MMNATPGSTLPAIPGYQLLGVIAEGGMCTIYRGRQQSTGKPVAIKVLPARSAEDEVSLKRFEQEYRTASALRHPHIVSVMEFSADHPTPYLVMEYIDGESIGDMLERRGKLTEEEAIRLVTQVCQGLHHAHSQGIVHRDIKPDNILVTRGGTAKLTDFGLVKEKQKDIDLTQTGRGLGTPYFMAPEQFRDAKNVDARCDIYSLGATLYHMVTGELPFGSSTPLEAWMKKIQNDLAPPRQINPELSQRIDYVIRKAMDNAPGRRYANCDELMSALTGRQFGSPQPHQDNEEQWILKYRSPQGQEYMLKRHLSGLRRLLECGLLRNATQVVASRSLQEPFLPLDQVPEFREFAPIPQPAGPPSDPPRLPKPATEPPTRGPVWNPSPDQLSPDNTVPPVEETIPNAERTCPVVSTPPQLEPTTAHKPTNDTWQWLLVLVVGLGVALVTGWFLFF